MNQSLKVFLMILLVFFILLNLFFGFPIITSYNNYLTERYLNSLKYFEYPNSRVINSSKYFGLLNGNSNHCDCEIFVLVESNLDFNEFQSYLKNNLVLKYPFSESSNSFYVYKFDNNNFYLLEKQKLKRIEKINNMIICVPNIDEYDFYIQKWEYKALKDLIDNIKIKENKNYYIITSFDQTFSGINMLDWRGH